MSSLLSAELAATCNALGYYDRITNKYHADENTLETVKDLIRYLRRDDENHDIRRFIGNSQVLRTDLLPLLKCYWEEADLFDVLLRLLVNLTSPALMLWNEEVPTEKTAKRYYMQIEDHLEKYKQAFADQAVWAVLSTKMSKILETDFIERGEENSLIIERILILIRNVLYVSGNPDAENRPDNDASVHDQVLWALHQSGMLDILLFITSSTNEHAYYMHTLEILSFMLREQSAAELAQAALQRTQTEKMRDEAELLSIRHSEAIQKQQKMRMYTGNRHSRFGGTFVVKSMKSISDNDLIYHKPLVKLDTLNFDADKKKIKTPKNRLPVKGTSLERLSAFSVRLFLKEFCIEFLNGAYNTLMYYAKDNLVRAKAQAHDESYYLWAMRFFMEFNRIYKFEVKLVSETMSIQTFHFVQQQMENYFDVISTEKKKFAFWSRRLHLSLLAYRELLLTICAMDKSSEPAVRDSANVIKSNIFYVLEYRELIVTLMVTFDETKMSLLYLNDLIETQHIFIKMLEVFCNKQGDVVLQKKSKAKRKKRKAPAMVALDDATSEMDLEVMWDEAAPQLSAVLEATSNIPTDVVPFDAASDVPIDEQKSDAMKNIQALLRDSEFENALGLLRAAREVWPENDCFGSSLMAPEDELLALRDIFFAELGENERRRKDAPREEYEDDEDEIDEEEMEGSGDMSTSEATYKFTDFAKRLAHRKIISACALALKTFDKNRVQTNHCIVKLLHRIAFDLKMFTMLFQASLFRTFQRIYALQALPQFRELAKFATYIMKQFFMVAQTNPKVFMEALFWKSPGDTYDIENGYGTSAEKSRAEMKGWSELQEDELRTLFVEHKEKQITDDVVDWIVNNLIDNTRSRRAVLKKLKEMCLLTEYKGPGKSGISTKTPRQWGEDEETQLRELYEQFKDAMDPLGCIIDRLDVRRPKNRIVEKLLELGIIQDKKEVHKKRARKSQGPRRAHGSNHSDDSGSQSDSSESDADVRRNKPQKKTTKNNNKKAPTQKINVSSAEVTRRLIEVKDMVEALEWLKESFSDAAEDFTENMDNDDDEGVPLVPILDAAVEAMENEKFLQLLRAMNIHAPCNEQETYWRIPGNITLSTLEQFVQLLTDALEGNLTVPVEPTTPAAESSDEEDIFSRVRTMINKVSEDESTPSEAEIGAEKEQADVLPSQPRRKRIAIESDDEEHQESEDNASQKNISTDTEATPNEAEIPEKETAGEVIKPKRKRIAIESDDDSQEPTEIAEDDVSGRRRLIDSDSDSEKVVVQTTDLSESPKNVVKRCRVLVSDDED